MGTITKSTAVKDWLVTIEDQRQDLIEAAKSGNRVASAFAMADARVALIESLKDADIRARLLKITDADVAMVELANNPTDEDRVRLCAIAILSGFVPGDEQFAIFGGGYDKKAGAPKAGKLYIKEAGYRTLFGHLGIVPDVNTEHPEFVKFGTGDKRVWKVAGTAKCVYHGQQYAIDYTGENALGIPGYESDNVAGVAAKARRRLLQALWITVSPILSNEADYADDEPEHVPPKNLTAPEPKSFEDTWREEFRGAKEPVASSAKALFVAYQKRDDVALDACLADLDQMKADGRLDTRAVDSLKRFVEAIYNEWDRTK